MRPKLICIGTSAGGVTALQQILGKLRRDFEIPIAVTQHLPAQASVEPQMVFGRYFSGTCVEAFDKDEIRPHSIYFAPPGYHMLIERDLSLSLSLDPPVHYARPSIDVFFESAATSLSRQVCGILLTGANQDGAQGLKAIADNGGVTIVQDPRTAEVSYMPKAALELFKPHFVLSLHEIAQKLNQFNDEVS